jgi:LysR family transcriptional regulator, glycine cleavage system transcriptional activator
MPETLPPLTAIRAFEVVARKLNFTRAAEELGLTQAAVSYQIKLLESWLGVSLFRRGPRGITLTEAAQRIAPQTVEAFGLLRETYDRSGARNHEMLSISTTFAYATKWLSPRLGAFSLSHPEIAVRLEATERVVDFGQEDMDVVIRAGNGKWPNLVATKVLDIDFAPMLSPKLAESIGGIRTPADVLKLPLLDPTHEWWSKWLTANGLPLDVLAKQQPATLHMQALDAAAAMNGLGVALLTPSYYREELAQGRLIQPLPAMPERDWAYWVAYPDGKRNLHRVKAFRDWLLSESAAGSAG